MRLTGGEGKGRRLAQPPPGVRPTSGRVKERLFQLAGDLVPGARVLDLFAGTGALGIEALARGAEHATFVEKNRRAQATIRDNVRRCRMEERTKLVPVDVMKYLAGSALQPFDLIFADPPYAERVLQDLLALVGPGGWLRSGGMLVFEASRRMEALLPDGWVEADARKVGDTMLYFLRFDRSDDTNDNTNG